MCSALQILAGGPRDDPSFLRRYLYGNDTGEVPLEWPATLEL